MTTENTTMEPVEQLPESPQRQRAPAAVRRGRRGSGMAVTAVALSLIALIVSGISLFLQLHTEPEEEIPEEPQPEVVEQPTLQYRNHVLPVLEGVPVNAYDAASFERGDDGFIRYLDAPIGIDVSSYQGEIDWAQVADAGVDFAMIRLGLRGYTKGGIMADAMFEQNIKGALDAGLDVGVYFFSQAISVWEAEEEAAYVLEHVKDYSITYPVVFDWESVGDAQARTNGISSDQVTRCAGAFCDMVAAAGYTPMIYFNMDQGYLAYQLNRLTDYAFWLAEYQESPGFYYQFDFWQYTHQGHVPGIDGAVDLDLDLSGYAVKAESTQEEP